MALYNATIMPYAMPTMSYATMQAARQPDNRDLQMQAARQQAKVRLGTAIWWGGVRPFITGPTRKTGDPPGREGTRGKRW